MERDAQSTAERRVCCAFPGLCLEYNDVIFKASKRWFHLLVSLGNPVCVRLLYLLWSQRPRAVCPPDGLHAADAAKTEPTAGSLGARNPRPSPPRTQEPSEAIRPNNLPHPPNCFLLLTKNRTSSSGSPQGNLSLL